MSISLLLRTIDPSLSRLDPTLLSDQALMEMVFENVTMTIDGKRYNRTDNGDSVDVCDWPQVECNEFENVIQFEESDRKLDGTLNLSYLPPNLKIFTLRWMWEDLHGTLETDHLPKSMEEFQLSSTKCDGSVNLTTLPPLIAKFKIRSNKFGGSCDLSTLPSTLQDLNIQDNKFSGTIVLDRLPSAMRNLDVCRNALCGTLDFSQLPETMLSLDVHDNEFSGEFVFTQAPPSMVSLIAGHNLFTGTARITTLQECRVYLPKTKVRVFVDQNDELLHDGFVMALTLAEYPEDEDYLDFLTHIAEA